MAKLPQIIPVSDLRQDAAKVLKLVAWCATSSGAKTLTTQGL